MLKFVKRLMMPTKEIVTVEISHKYTVREWTMISEAQVKAAIHMALSDKLEELGAIDYKHYKCEESDHLIMRAQLKFIKP